jgi:hypothetical protein
MDFQERPPSESSTTLSSYLISRRVSPEALHATGLKLRLVFAVGEGEAADGGGVSDS